MNLNYKAIDSFRKDVELAVSKHIKNLTSDDVEGFLWLTPSGTGSTSVRYIVRVSMMGCETMETLDYFVKHYTIQDKFSNNLQQAESEFTILKHLDKLSDEKWTTPEPIAILPRHKTLIMGFCPGINVNYKFWNLIKYSALYTGRSSSAIKLVRDVAKVLKSIQSVDLINQFPVADHRWYKVRFNRDIEALHSLKVSANKLKTIQEIVLQALPDMLEKNNTCFQHTDFFLNNLIQNKNTFSVIDFPNSVVGTMYWDVSHLLISLEDFKLYRNVKNGIIDACKNEVLKIFKFEDTLMQSMNLLHYCFSYKIHLMGNSKGPKKIFTHNPTKFYEKRIKTIINRQYA